jgi:hypothetical protein
MDVWMNDQVVSMLTKTDWLWIAINGRRTFVMVVTNLCGPKNSVLNTDTPDLTRVKLRLTDLYSALVSQSVSSLKSCLKFICSLRCALTRYKGMRRQLPWQQNLFSITATCCSISFQLH